MTEDGNTNAAARGRRSDFVGQCFVMVATAGLIMIPLAFFGMGVWMLYGTVGANTFYRSTPGTMVSAKLEISDSGGERSVDVALKYTYDVDGQTYKGHRYNAGTGPADRDCDDVVAELQPGTGVTVFYDPFWPSLSVLSRDPTPYLLMLIVLSGILTIGPVTIVRAWKRERRLNPKSFRQRWVDWLHGPLNMWVRRPVWLWLAVIILFGLVITFVGVLLFVRPPQESAILIWWFGVLLLLVGTGLTGLFSVRAYQQLRGEQADVDIPPQYR